MADESKSASSGADADAPPRGADSGRPAQASGDGSHQPAEASGDDAGPPALNDAPDDLGRPIGRDEIDPELVGLIRPRTRIGPLLAVSVVVFCAYIMTRLYGDLRYSQKPEAPQVYDSVAALLEQGEPEQYVQVRAVPDRSFAMQVAHSEAQDGHRLVPVQGTDGMLWLMLDGSVWATDLTYDEIHVGRLRPMATLPFADHVREHLARRAPAPRYVQAATLREALAGNSTTLVTPGGDRFEAVPTSRVHFVELVSDRALLRGVTTERLADEAALTQALADAGLVAPGSPAEREGDKWLVYRATVPGGAPAARSMLEQAKLFSVNAEPIETTYDTTLGALSSAGDDLIVDGKSVPWSSLSWIALYVPRSMPAGAQVIVTQDRPQTYWYVLPVFVLVGLFGMIFFWALVHSLRSDRGSSPGSAQGSAQGSDHRTPGAAPKPV